MWDWEMRVCQMIYYNTVVLPTCQTLVTTVIVILAREEQQPTDLGSLSSGAR